MSTVYRQWNERQTAWSSRTKRELVDQAVIDAFGSLDKTSWSLGLERLSVRKEMSALADAVVKQEAWSELIGRLEKEFSKEIADANERLEKARQDLERAKIEFLQSDVRSKRMLTWARYVDDILPTDRYNGCTDQTVRSRGLVMAALAGMTSVGGAGETKNETSQTSDDGDGDYDDEEVDQ